jgi:hypothetical protein
LPGKQLLRALLIASSLAAQGVALADDPASAPPEQTPPATPTTTPPTGGTPPGDNTAQSAGEQKEDKVVCKKTDPPLGSRMGAKKVCKKESEWRREREAAQETADKIQTPGITTEPQSN